MTKRTKFTVIFLIILLLLSAGALSYFLNHVLHLDSYKDQILAETQRVLNRQVSYEKGDFSFRFGPSFTFTKVVIKEPGSTKNFVAADHVTLKIALMPLLERNVSIKEVILDRPDINLVRDSNGRFNFNDLLQQGQTTSSFSVHLKGLKVIKGSVSLHDRAVTAAGVFSRLENIDLYINHPIRGKNCSLKLAATLGGGAQGRVAMNGSIKLTDKTKPLTESHANMKVETQGLDAGHFWPYYLKFVPFNKVLGSFDADFTFKGQLKNFTSKGAVRAANVRFDYPRVFHAVLTPRDVHFNYALEVSPRQVEVKSIDLTVDRLNVKGSCAILDLDSADPRIVAKAATSHFRLEEFAGYIPYGIIVTDTADFIEQHIAGGTYKLDEGRLEGKISQILHMERGQNYNVLFIRGTVDKGIVSYGGSIPTFNSIKGHLEMRGKDFNLIGMSGNFGSSPFKLDGKISDYPLNTPSSYPFTMSMVPQQAEVAWLLGKEQAKHLTLTGSSILNIQGNGFTSGYNLAGDWNLTTAAYSFSDLINKPVKKLNRLSFKGFLDKKQAKLTELSYDLNPLQLTLGAQYHYNGELPLSLSIQTNQFAAGEIAPMVPFIKQYHPTGKLQAAITGKASGKDSGKFAWGGNLSFSAFSIKPPNPVKTVSNMSGTIHFKGDELETSQLSAKLGNSNIAAKGSIKGFKNPTMNLAISSPSLTMADLGFSAPTDVQLEKVAASFSMKDKDLQIKELSAHIKESQLTIKGTVHDVDNPNVDIAVTSAFLNIEDLLLLTKLQGTGKEKTSTARLKMKANINAAAGKFKSIEFKRFKTVASIDDKILYLQQLHCSAFGGDVSGKVRYDSGSNGPPHYQVGFTLDRVSAEKVTRSLGIKQQEITGTLSLHGDLAAKGDTSEDIKRTALGSVKLNLEEGSLRRFATLSKIFSLLNVSQLLKFQWPDMVSGGMPYNRITGSLAIRDGIVSTKDLFLDGDAMNISCVGKIDLTKEEIDATFGVQPLQTVDKVVSRIPVVNWLLTGKNGTLVTAYFVARGKLDDPIVNAFPVKDMAKGVLDIFKRVFQLPGKLITNTGEVITGK